MRPIGLKSNTALFHSNILHVCNNTAVFHNGHADTHTLSGIVEKRKDYGFREGTRVSIRATYIVTKCHVDKLIKIKKTRIRGNQ